MKFDSTQNPVLDDIKAALIREFKKPKSESQCITELKEIQRRRGKSVWDFDQRFKVLLDQVSFMIGLAQHKEWFIAALLPHIRAPLMQQKVADQQEALEIAIKLETALVEDNSGIAQIQAQLTEMDLELRDMKKGKSIREEVWCICCRIEGHDKDQCLALRNYLNTGAPNLLNPTVLTIKSVKLLASIDRKTAICYRGMFKSRRTLTVNSVNPLATMKMNVAALTL